MASNTIVITITIFGWISAVFAQRYFIDQRSNRQNGFEYQAFQQQPSPLNTIVNAITTPLNILANRLSQSQQPYEQPHPHDHRHHHRPQPPHHFHNGYRGPESQPPSPFYSSPELQRPSPNPYEQFDHGPMHINQQNPFLNKNPFLQNVPQHTTYPSFPQASNNANGNNLFIQRQPQPNPFNINNGYGNPQQQQPVPSNSNNNLVNNIFGTTPSNCQQNCGTNQKQQNSGGGPVLVMSTFDGFGANGNPKTQPQTNLKPNNPSNNLFVNNGNNGDLVESTFSGFGPQTTNNNGDLIDSIFANPTKTNDGSSQAPNTNSGSQQNVQPQGDDLIQSVFPGFDKNNLKPNYPSNNLFSNNGIFGTTPSNCQQNCGTNQKQQNSGGGPVLVMSTFDGFGADGNPKTQPQTNSNNGNNGDLIESIFAGFGPQTANPTKTNDGSSQAPNTNNGSQQNLQTEGGDLIQSVFPGFDNNNNSKNPQGNNFQPAQTSTTPPSTTNSNGLIYDIDIRSS